MQKVKLTREQADVIEKVKCNSDDKVDTFLEYHLAHRHSYKDAFTPLLDLTVDEIAIALHVGYEVEPEFNVGDWLHLHLNNEDVVREYHSPSHMKEHHFYKNLEGRPRPFSGEDYIRHATPEEIAEEKERRLFAENGREPWELAGGDILKANDGGYLVTVKAILPGGHPLFEGGEVYVDIENVKRDYKVACFSEDRKDVDNE